MWFMLSGLGLLFGVGDIGVNCIWDGVVICWFFCGVKVCIIDLVCSCVVVLVGVKIVSFGEVVVVVFRGCFDIWFFGELILGWVIFN